MKRQSRTVGAFACIDAQTLVTGGEPYVAARFQCAALSMEALAAKKGRVLVVPSIRVRETRPTTSRGSYAEAVNFLRGLLTNTETSLATALEAARLLLGVPKA